MDSADRTFYMFYIEPFKVLYRTCSSKSVLTLLHTLLEEKVLYRTLKGSISARYLEPLKGSVHS